MDCLSLLTNCEQIIYLQRTHNLDLLWNSYGTQVMCNEKDAKLECPYIYICQNSKQRREIRKYTRCLTWNLKRKNHKLYLHNLKTIHNRRYNENIKHTYIRRWISYNGRREEIFEESFWLEGLHDEREWREKGEQDI